MLLVNSIVLLSTWIVRAAGSTGRVRSWEALSGTAVAARWGGGVPLPCQLSRREGTAPVTVVVVAARAVVKLISSSVVGGLGGGCMLWGCAREA